MAKWSFKYFNAKFSHKQLVAAAVGVAFVLDKMSF